jgi:pimeloyl-ACP methyl ester carboxylesterase
MPDTPIAMPKLGMSMEEGRVVAWPLPLGSAVAKGETVLIIESEKAEVEIEATAAGVLRHIYVEPDETVPCGSLLAALTESAESAFDAEAFHAEHHRPEPAGAAAAPAAAVAPGAAPTATPGERRGGPATPAARALARKLGIELGGLVGSGPGGRITKEDVEAAHRDDDRVPVAEGIALEVLAAGSGPTVLMLPGFGSDASSFAAQSGLLAEAFAVKVVHPRGVRASTAPVAERYDVAQMASDALAVANGPLHLVGASLGAAAAIEAALMAPERVASLALVTPFLSASPRLVAVLDAWGRGVGETSPELVARTLLPWLFSSAWLADDEQRERTVRGLSTMLGCASAEVLARYVAGIAAWSGARTGDLGSLVAPVLVIGAGGDLLTTEASALADALPKARYLEVPGAGHAVCLEASEVVSEALAAHLRDVS